MYPCNEAAPDAPHTATNAAPPPPPPWASPAGSFRSARAAGKNVSTAEQQIAHDELNGFRFSEFSRVLQKSSSSTTTAHRRGGGHSGFASMLPAMNPETSCSSGRRKGFYTTYCRGFLNGTDHESTLETTHLNDAGIVSSWNPDSLGLMQQEPAASLPQPTAGGFCYGASAGGAPESRIGTASFLHQGSVIQTAATSPGSTNNMDLLQAMEEATEDNNEAAAHTMSLIMCPQDENFIPRSTGDINQGGAAQVLVQEYYSTTTPWGSSSWGAAEHDHVVLADYHFRENKPCVQEASASAAATSTNQLLKTGFYCPEFTAAAGRCHHAVSYPYQCLNVKELEEREWRKLLRKELTNSDVGNLGRIVLPKKEAEANLPPLLEKDGLVLEMVDMANHLVWGFKYRFWPNNRSRMYVLENTGDFAKTNQLQIRDSLVVYGDEASRYYLVGVEKKATGVKVMRGNGAVDELRVDVNKVRRSERKRR